MNRLLFSLLMTLLAGILVLPACAGWQATPVIQGQPPEAAANEVGPPVAYADLENPLAGDELAASRGAEIFQADCASCHGASGYGDGLSGVSLQPKPVNLVASQTTRSDAYLFWRISEGGALAPFRSRMPAWKSLLSEEDIWKIIAYLRTLESSR